MMDYRKVLRENSRQALKFIKSLPPPSTERKGSNHERLHDPGKASAKSRKA
jgi:hypothetical protein